MTTPEATAAAPRTRITDPAQIHGAFMAAVNARDVEAVLALYDTDGVAVELDGSECSGPAAMRAMVEGLVGAITHIEGSTRKLFVVGDVALGSGSWTAQVALPDGTTIEQRGTTAEVSRRQPDGTWRLVIDDPLF